MKNLSFLMFIAWLSVMPAMAQVSPGPAPGYDPGEFNRLMQKSKNLKTAGWWMLGGGAALVGGSMIWLSGDAASHVMQWEEPDVNDGPTIMAAVGLLSMAGSVPVFISAGNVRKKAQLVASSQPLSLGWKAGRQQAIPSVSLQIPLGR